MAAPMVSVKAPSLFALAMVALLVSSCDASTSRDVPGASASTNEIVVQDNPKCEVMMPCNVVDGTQYCINIGVRQKGSCTLKPPDLEIYCCCPVVSA